PGLKCIMVNLCADVRPAPGRAGVSARQRPDLDRAGVVRGRFALAGAADGSLSRLALVDDNHRPEPRFVRRAASRAVGDLEHPQPDKPDRVGYVSDASHGRGSRLVRRSDTLLANPKAASLDSDRPISSGHPAGFNLVAAPAPDGAAGRGLV